MDLKTFADDDFDPKKWINRAWSGGGNQEKEIFVANTVARLQLYMKQLSNSLDETATQIVSSVPRTVADAAALQLEAARLQQRLVALEQTVQGVEEQTGHSIKSLQKIDHLKSRLENAASALKEADKWVALAQSLEDTLDSGVPTQRDKLSALAVQVEAMTASLEVLSDSPEYEAKRIQLATLYNRLEAAISPPFIEALTQMDADRTSSYVSVFRGMSRGAGALRCWRRAAAATRAARWARVTSHTPRAATHLLLDDAHAQVEWLSTVLRCEAPLCELLLLLTDLLLSLDPSLTKIVTANFKLCQNPEEGITYLADLRRDLDEFATGVRAVLDSTKYNKERVSQAVLRALWCALYGPLRALLPRYTELQAALLAATLQRHGLGSDDLLEHARAVLLVCSRAGGWLGAAYSTGHSIAGDAIQTYHAPAAESFLQSLLSLITSHTRRVEASFLSSCRAPRGGSALDAFPAALALERAAGALREGAGAAGGGEGQGAGGSVGESAGGDGDELTSYALMVSRALMPASGTAPAAGPPPSAAGLQRASDALKTLARNILRHPIDVQLDKIPQLSAWSDNDALSTELPDFSLSPQEYITEVGQYLMTLPQHLELHLGDAREPWRLLTELCAHTCEVYAQKILSIRNMDALGTKRCLTDIAYLSSVVEDLGSSITPALKNLEKSLRAATPAQSE